MNLTELTGSQRNALSRFLATRDRIHTFLGQGGCDMDTKWIMECADNGAYLSDPGSFSDTLGHQVTVMVRGKRVSIEVSTADLDVFNLHEGRAYYWRDPAGDGCDDVGCSTWVTVRGGVDQEVVLCTTHAGGEVEVYAHELFDEEVTREPCPA